MLANHIRGAGGSRALLVQVHPAHKANIQRFNLLCCAEPQTLSHSRSRFTAPPHFPKPGALPSRSSQTAKTAKLSLETTILPPLPRGSRRSSSTTPTSESSPAQPPLVFESI